jgi:hypothetical protein
MSRAQKSSVESNRNTPLVYCVQPSASRCEPWGIMRPTLLSQKRPFWELSQKQPKSRARGPQTCPGIRSEIEVPKRMSLTTGWPVSSIGTENWNRDRYAARSSRTSGSRSGRSLPCRIDFFRLNSYPPNRPAPNSFFVTSRHLESNALKSLDFLACRSLYTMTIPYRVCRSSAQKPKPSETGRFARRPLLPDRPLGSRPPPGPCACTRRRAGSRPRADAGRYGQDSRHDHRFDGPQEDCLLQLIGRVAL